MNLPKNLKIGYLRCRDNPGWKMLNALSIWMSDPSGCITYKPAALELYVQHANLRCVNLKKQRITALTDILMEDKNVFGE